MIEAYTYLRVVDDEITLRRLTEQACLSARELKPTKVVKDGAPSQLLWYWSSPRQPLTLPDADAAVKALLLQQKHIFPTLREYAAKGTGVFLEIVVQCDIQAQPDRPGWGWFLTRETISLLEESGASLDYDIGWR
jgi:hypothetical protein